MGTTVVTNKGRKNIGRMWQVALARTRQMDGLS